jgi:hypothetical protein
MDATWGRGKYRTEVWEDDVNPVDFWWKAYEPSQEELEAMDAGFDFNDGKKWLEVCSLFVSYYLSGSKSAFFVAGTLSTRGLLGCVLLFTFPTCSLLKERGFDYKAAQAETLALTAARYEEFRKVRRVRRCKHTSLKIPPCGE